MERGNNYLKIIDRYIGIPLLFVLSFFHVQRKDCPKNIKRIAFIKGAAIGDTVLLSAIIQDIRDEIPTVQINFYCGKTCYEIAKLIPGIDKVSLIPMTNPLKTLRILRGEGVFDIVIDSGPWSRLEAVFAFFTKAKYRIGFNSIDQYRHYCFDRVVLHLNDRHELENNRELVKPFLHSVNNLPVITVPPIELNVLMNRLNIPSDKPYCVLHPWSGGYKGKFKEWLPERWETLCGWLKDNNLTPVLSGASGDIQNTEYIANLCSERHVNVINIAGKISLEELIVVLKNSKILISVNTGVLHIAAAISTPVVGINGPVPSLRWGAVSPRSVNIDCSPPLFGYIHLGFEYPKIPPPCMESIHITDVINATRQVLNGDLFKL